MIRGPKKAISVVLPLELYERLHGMAQENEWKLAPYIRQILRRYLRYVEEHQENQKDKWIVKK